MADAKRVALVIGMSDYQHLSKLPNPVPRRQGHRRRVARATASRCPNITISTAPICSTRSRNSKREATGAEVALVYYAGHGMSIDGKNVLAPTDMEIECEDKTTIRSVELEQLYKARRARRRSRSCCSTPAATIPFPQCPTRGVRSRQRLSRSLSAWRGGPLGGHRQRHAVGPARGGRRCRRAFALRQALLREFRRESPRHFARFARHDREGGEASHRADASARDHHQGGSPRVCLDATGCGATPAASCLPIGRAHRCRRRSPRRVGVLKQLGFIATRTAAETTNRCRTRSSAFRPRPG